jgi:outer membrane lipoprotein-sorting protein
MNGPCPQMQNKIVDYVLGVLSEPEIDALREHLRGCPECRKYVRALEDESYLLVQLGKQVEADMPSREDKVIQALNRSAPTVHIEPLSLWRQIMKNPITKLAAVAVIIIAVVVGVNQFIGPVSVTSVALADVLERIEQAQAYMYKMKMSTTGAMMPGTPAREMEMEATATISNEYGMKMEMTTVDANSGEKTIQQMYMIPNDKVVVMVMPGQKKYIRMEFTEDLLARMKKQNNDPREMVKQIMGCNYTELGRSVIDGVEVQGFETTDSRFMAGMAQQLRIKLWVDAATWLPVRQEHNIQVNERMQMHGVVYDYQWNIAVDAREFEPVIPEDFTAFPAGGMKMPEMSEEAAIEGLRIFAELTGKYPKTLNLLTLMQELGQELGNLKDSQSPASEQLRQAFKQPQSEDEKAKVLVDMMKPVQSIGMFYMTLVQDKKEPVYHGESVGPDDVALVLLRWKIEAGNYRVIFADLTVAEVTADELAELEKKSLR